MSLVRDGLAKAWAEELTASAGFAFFPHRHDGETEPPFGVVLVKRLRQILPATDVHLAEVRIVVVTDAADTSVAEHRQRVGQAYAAIQETPTPASDEANGVVLCGFVVEEIEQVTGSGNDGGKVCSDVFMITAGVKAMVFR